MQDVERRVASSLREVPEQNGSTRVADRTRWLDSPALERRSESELRALQRTKRDLEGAVEHYRSLHDETPLEYLVLDAGGQIVESTRRARELLGHSRSELVETPLCAFFSDSDAARLESAFAALTNQQAGSQRSLKLELTLQTGRAPAMHVAVYLKACDQGNGALQVVLCEEERTSALEAAGADPAEIAARARRSVHELNNELGIVSLGAQALMAAVGVDHPLRSRVVALSVAAHEAAQAGARLVEIAAGRGDDADSCSERQPVALVMLSDRDARREVVAPLQKLGYRVEKAEHVFEAACVAARLSVDILISNVMVPGTSNRELLSLMLSRHPTLQSIYVINGSRRKLLASGVIDLSVAVLVRPVRISSLRQTLVGLANMTHQRGSGRSVLLVGVTAARRERLEPYLHRRGYLVTACAESKLPAYLERSHFDLMIGELPGVDEHEELLVRFHAQAPNTPVLLLATSSIDAPVGTHVLTEPFELRALDRAVQAAVGRRR